MHIGNRQPSHLGNRESGISTLLILLGLMLILGSTGLLIGNYKSSQKAEDSITGAIRSENGTRFVLQMVSDDELCTETDFMDGLTGYKLDGTNTGYIDLKKAGYVDYSSIGVTDMKWPSQGVNESYKTSGHAFGSRAHVEGVAIPVGLYYEQPPQLKRPVVVTEIGTRKLTRVPVDVWQRGTIAGTPAFFHQIATYIEFDSTAADPTKPVACYRDVSSRSLCLDRGGEFDPAKPLKCTVN